MRVEKLEVKNYRGLKEFNIELLRIILIKKHD